MDEDCVKAFVEYGCNVFYNPSALYKKAIDASSAVKNARNVLAKSLGAKGEEIIFTASGSEGDNIALLCSLRAKTGKVIVGSSEHSAVYNAALELKVRGYDVIFAPCDKFGRTEVEKLSELLDEKVVLVSIMHVCNETGALNDLAAISKLIKVKSPRAIFHSDGVQAYGKIPVRVKELGVDLYTLSAHKVHAPKGVGALYCRSGLFLKTFVYGGGQEFGIRSATENVAGVVAFASVVEKGFSRIKEHYDCVASLRDYLVEKLSDNFENLKINTDLQKSSPYILSFAINSAQGEVLVHCLEDKGVLVGTGSACSSRKSTKRIPQALGITDDYAQGMLRVSFCERNSKKDIDAFINALKESLEELIKYQNKSSSKEDCILSRLKKR
ncbi:MAG: cysteine desulfurase [Clostridia bacterium]|nr:cysteine desulfurase [Clostridia bacterium]MDE7328706.1 cysteine desulfurase [Clostridia bacterium]